MVYSICRDCVDSRNRPDYVAVAFSRLAGNASRVQSVLDSPVLVLNRLWQAVNVCSARRAFNLLYEGHAQVVAAGEGKEFLTHDFESWLDLSARAPEPVMIHGVSIKLRVPRVIVLMLFDRLPKQDVKFTRHNIFERDGTRASIAGGCSTART